MPTTPAGNWDGHQANGNGHRLWELADELQTVGFSALVLWGLLLLVAFARRVAGLSDTQLAMYGTAVTFAAVAAVLLLAPAACQRLPSALRPPLERQITAVNRMAAGGLAAAGLAAAAAVRLAARCAEPRLAADLSGAGTLAVFLAVWFALPWLSGHRRPPASSSAPHTQSANGRRAGG